MPLCSIQGQPRPRYEVASRPSSGGCCLSDLGQASFHGAHTAGTAQRHWAEIPTEGGQATAHTRPSLSSHGSPEVDGPGRHPRLHSPHSTPAGEGAAWMALWQVGHLGSLAWTAASPTALATLHMCHRYGPQAPHTPHVPQTQATCSTQSTCTTDTGHTCHMFHTHHRHGCTRAEQKGGKNHEAQDSSQDVGEESLIQTQVPEDTAAGRCMYMDWHAHMQVHRPVPACTQHTHEQGWQHTDVTGLVHTHVIEL